MSTLERRYGTASPRTPELPRAFTFGEFCIGALWAWFWYQPLLVATVSIDSVFNGGGDLVFVFLIPLLAVPIGFAAAVVGSPIAYLIGYLLRAIRHDATHLVAFAGYGALVGAAVVNMVFTRGDFSWDTTGIYGGPAAAAVALGWWTTSRLALRKDRNTPADATSCGIRPRRDRVKWRALPAIFGHMADTVAEHLQVKKGEKIAVVGATPEQRELLLPLPEGSVEASVDEADAVFAFSPTLDRLHADFAELLPRLGKARVVWWCYLKGGRSELNRDVMAGAVLDHGWRAIGNRPLNDEWSGLRVRPLKPSEDPVALRP